METCETCRGKIRHVTNGKSGDESQQQRLPTMAVEAYNAWANHFCWRNEQGGAIRSFEQLSKDEQYAWGCAAQAVHDATLREHAEK